MGPLEGKVVEKNKAVLTLQVLLHWPCLHGSRGTCVGLSSGTRWAIRFAWAVLRLNYYTDQKISEEMLRT